MGKGNMWNVETTARLDEWYSSPRGAFALEQERLLVQYLVSEWPRRGHSLLDVGCGTGIFTEMFREYGFDVTGCDNSREMLAASRARLGHQADLRLGQAEHLPFEDDSMEYVALLSVLTYVSDPGSALAEALRVARRGVIVGFLNRWSAYGVYDSLVENRRGRCCKRWISLGWISRTARSLCPHCRIRSRSVLPGPPPTWKASFFWGRLNRLRLSVPLGAYVGVCINVRVEAPLTPLHLTVHIPAEKSALCGTATSCGAPRSHGF